MKRIKVILLLLMTLAVFNPATRADELSDLVAVVAASSNSSRVDVAMLDGIFRSMKQESYRNMQREIGGMPDFQSQSALGHMGFFRPVPGIITSRFGWREQFHREHHGVDLSLEVGDTVRAALSGMVERISFDHDGYGNFVVLRHSDGMETLYGHLQYATVVEGEFLNAGQAVGIGGNTGNSTGPHLHFEARVAGVAVDPLLLFDFNVSSGYLADGQTDTETDTPKVPLYSHQKKSLKKQETYVVRYGDTLESVAYQAGISVMRLCQLNMLQQSSPLEVGRMLKIK